MSTFLLHFTYIKAWNILRINLKYAKKLRYSYSKSIVRSFNFYIFYIGSITDYTAKLICQLSADIAASIKAIFSRSRAAFARTPSTTLAGAFAIKP